MALKRMMKAGIVIALVSLIAAPAGAGPTHEEANLIRGAEVAGKLQVSPGLVGSFSLDIRQVQGVAVDGQIQLLPTPAPPTPSQEPPVNVGCIEIDAGPFGKDFSCKFKGFQTVDIDPAMNSGALVLNYESEAPDLEGFTINVVLLLSGEGDIGPSMSGSDPSVDQDAFSFDNEILLARNVVVTAGSIRSHGLGTRGATVGGAILSADSARMFTGVQILGDGDLTCTVSLSGNCLN